MTSTAASFTFRAFDAEGALIAQSRGRAGALDKVIGELRAYRGAVARASGRLFGGPQRLGFYSVDGVREALGFVDHLMPGAHEIARLDRIGLARVVEIQAEIEAEAAAAEVA